MKNYFNYKSFFSNFLISKITKESKISLKCHYLKYFIYFSLNKIFQFGLFLRTKLSIIMIYCSKVVVLFFGFWILPIICVMTYVFYGRPIIEFIKVSKKMLSLLIASCSKLQFILIYYKLIQVTIFFVCIIILSEIYI